MSAQPEGGGSGPARRKPSPWEVLAAIAFLNGLLALDFPAGENPAASLFRAAPDALAALACAGLASRAPSPWSRRLLVPLAALVLGLRLFRSADLLVPLVFNRPFNLYLDAPRLPDLLANFGLTRPAAGLLAAGGGALAAAAALAWTVWRALAAVEEGLAAAGAARRAALAAGAALGLAVAGAHLGPEPFRLAAPGILPRVAEEARFILDLDQTRAGHREAIARAAARTRAAPADLARLRGATVLIFVVESYGESAFSDPRFATAVRRAAAAAERRLQAAGRRALSGYFASPTFGGSSWLAHGTLESGVRLACELRHGLLLEADFVPLAEIYNRAGYRTVRAMPGTLWPWPAGAVFRYQRTYIAPDFGYRGPAFSWNPVPDQFALDWIDRREIRTADRPLLAEFILGDSHAPWDVLPPRVAPWELIGDGRGFERLPPRRFPTSWTALAEAAEAYGEFIAHELELIAEFICRALPEEGLAVILGDHQPCRELLGAEPSHAVPVHLVSGRADLLEAIGGGDFIPGMAPGPPPPHPGLERLFSLLTAGLSAGQVEPVRRRKETPWPSNKSWSMPATGSSPSP